MSGIRLWRGDICDLETEAIVVPATPALWMTAGVAAAVKQRGGHGIEFEAVSHAPAPAGTAVATSPGLLPCRYVIHVVSLTPERRATASGVEAGTRAAIDLADSLGVRAIALPSLGSPRGGVPLPECARIMVRTLRAALAAHPRVEEIVLALRSDSTYETFREELGRATLLRAVPVEPGAHAGLVGVMGADGAADLEDADAWADEATATGGTVDATGEDRRPEGVR